MAADPGSFEIFLDIKKQSQRWVTTANLLRTLHLFLAVIATASTVAVAANVDNLPAEFEATQSQSTTKAVNPAGLTHSFRIKSLVDFRLPYPHFVRPGVWDIRSTPVKLSLRDISFLSALSTALLNTFQFGSRSVAYDDAWRRVKVALMKKQADLIGTNDLINAYRDAEEILRASGNVMLFSSLNNSGSRGLPALETLDPQIRASSAVEAGKAPISSIEEPEAVTETKATKSEDHFLDKPAE